MGGRFWHDTRVRLTRASCVLNPAFSVSTLSTASPDSHHLSRPPRLVQLRQPVAWKHHLDDHRPILHRFGADRDAGGAGHGAARGRGDFHGASYGFTILTTVGTFGLFGLVVLVRSLNLLKDLPCLLADCIRGWLITKGLE